MYEEKLTKCVKLLTFNGDEEKFRLWLGFGAAVGDAPEADLPVSEAFTLILSEKKAAVSRNRVAMATLTMVMRTNKTMGALNEAKDTSWPAGVAWKVVKKLKEKNQPMDIV